MAKPPIAKDPFEQIAASLPTYDEEQLREAREMTLRQHGARDPLPGAPLRWPLSAEPDDVAAIEPGRWGEEGFDDRATGLPPGCPVTPLGKDDKSCFFLDTMGVVAELEATSSGKGPIGYLFAGRSRYLEWAWPRFGRAPRGGGRGPVVGWEADNARQCLVDACAYKGYFALEDQVRGRGAWRDDDDGLIFHAGDKVWYEGAWHPPGVYGRFIYPARPKIGRPSSHPQPAGPGSAGDYIFEILQTFNWDRAELDPLMMLGWLVCAKVGGALDRRPVAFIHGGEGSGKSTLQGLLRVLMTGAMVGTSNTTQAGLYQRLRQDSIAIVVDELEAKGDDRVVGKILELARIAYSGDKMQRGGKDGVGKEFALMSSFMGSAISKPATTAQDDSRMWLGMLREREHAGGKIDIKHNELDALGRHLLRRIFDWWPRWKDLNAAIRGALIAAGHNDRACDTFAPLAAGAHLALSDAMPTDEELAAWTRRLRADELEETATRERTWRRCLVHLVNAQPDLFRTRHHKSVGSVLEAWRTSASAITDVEDYLPQVGLSISFAKDEPNRRYETARLFVPANHPGLHALYAGTDWSGHLAAPGPWAGVLRQMPKELWENGKCDKGLDRKASGLFIQLAKALEA